MGLVLKYKMDESKKQEEGRSGEMKELSNSEVSI